MDGLTALVADAIVEWARHQSTLIRGVPLLPIRLDLGDRSLAQAVRERLEPLSGVAAWYKVRESPDVDAVRLRNGRPGDAPVGVTDDTPLLYVVFWLPGEVGHELNAQSLADLPSVGIARLLADPEHFAFPVEAAIANKCQQAAEAWPAKVREDAGASLLAAWNAVRGAIRTGSAGRGGAIKFVERLEDYARFLDRALIPEETWSSLPITERPARLVAAWGDALPSLGMFHMPALATVVGIPIRPDQRLKRGRSQESWGSALLRTLAENREAEMDHASLADTIAGKLSVEKQIATLTKRGIKLSSSNPDSAREALLLFCRTGDPSTREQVEWLFFEKPDDRRSAQHGLRGLLVARNVRKPPVDPVDRAVTETQDALLAAASDARAEAIVGYVQHFRPTNDEPERVQLAPSALRALNEGQLPSEPPPSTLEREALREVMASPSLDAARLNRAITLWEDLAASSRTPGAEVFAPTVLLGLARLCSKRLGPAVEGRCFPEPRKPIADDQIYLRYLAKRGVDVPDFLCPVDAWDDATMARLGTWIRENAVPAYKGETDEDDEDIEGEDEESALVFEVGRRSGPTLQPLGTIEIDVNPDSEDVTGRTAEHLASWHEVIPMGSEPGRRRPGLMFAGNPLVEEATGLADGWNRWTASLSKDNAGWSLASLIAPVSKAAVDWVDAWCNQLERVRSGAAAAGVEARRKQLEAERDAAIERDDHSLSKELTAELKQLNAELGGTEPPKIESVRSLLRLCTGRRSRDGVVEQLVLLPQHPLVLRLRRLADGVLQDVLQTIWTIGWPEAGLDHLRDALDDWGLPEPLHFYGFWDGDPLVFDTWIGDTGLAVFGRLATARSSHGVGPGVGEVTRTVDRYVRLYRAAGDRLGLRILGDRDSKWAMKVLEQLIDTRKSAFRADVAVGGSLADLDDEILQVQLGAEERARAFEMSDDGAQPRVRVRRVNEEDAEPVHLAITLGDAVPAFSPQADRQAPPSAYRKSWDSSVLFAEAIPRPDMNAFVVQDPRDELSLLAASAVGYARNGQLSVHVERYSFDETRVGAPLQKLHAGAHWLVLVSRQPLHRAVQAAGEQVASLLDFRTISERNRAVHVSVSIGAGQFQGDLARLEGMLRVLLGTAIPGLGRALVRAARVFVPGVAINAVGGTSTSHLEGLLGLILTQREIAGPERLVLSIDQHQELLSRRVGPIGDVLLLQHAGDSLRVSVSESKFTRGVVSADSPVASTAARQVRSTLEKLGHLSVQHPLSFVARHMLARAISAQIQLAANDELTIRLEPFLQSALDRKCPLLIEPHTKCAVYLWSMSGETSDKAVSPPSEVTFFSHSRSTTLARLHDLAASA